MKTISLILVSLVAAWTVVGCGSPESQKADTSKVAPETVENKANGLGTGTRTDTSSAP